MASLFDIELTSLVMAILAKTAMQAECLSTTIRTLSKKKTGFEMFFKDYSNLLEFLISLGNLPSNAGTPNGLIITVP